MPSNDSTLSDRFVSSIESNLDPHSLEAGHPQVTVQLRDDDRIKGEAVGHDSIALLDIARRYGFIPVDHEIDVDDTRSINLGPTSSVVVTETWTFE